MSRVSRALAGLLLLAACPAPARGGGAGADGVFEERSSSHFRLLQDVAIDRASGWTGSVRFEREVLAVLESGYDRLDALLGLRPGRRLDVFVYDPQIFDAWFAGLFAFPAAGFYEGRMRVRGDTAVTAPLERTLLHELVHAAFDAQAPSLVLPGWLNEGLAEWFEARATGKARLSPGEYEALARAARAGELPPLAALALASFGGLEASHAGWGYLYAYGLIDFAARTRGEAALRRLGAELVRRGDPARAVRRALGRDAAALDAAFRSELAGG